MKGHIFILFALTITTTATAGTNPLFAPGTENSIGIFIGQSTGDGDLGHLINPFDWDISPMTFFGIQYSQPTTILRMPSRINVEAMQNIAYDSASGASFGAVGISWDIALFSWCGFYVGAGLGEYLRDVKAGINPDVPVNYFPDDDDTKEPICTWRSSANLLYCNWLNYFVYQATPYDLTKVGVVLMDDHMPAWIRDEKK